MKQAKAFEKLITSDATESFVKDIGEAIIDSSLQEGLLKEIPLLNTVVTTGQTIKSHFFLKKLLNLSKEIEIIPFEKRKEVIDRINSDKKYRSSVGETLLEHLDRLESDFKPEILGKLFAAVINEEITYAEFLKASHVLNRVFYWDLVELKKNTNEKNEVAYNPPDELLFNGIIVTDFLDVFESAKSNESNEKPNQTTLTDIGHLIVNIGMKVI